MRTIKLRNWGPQGFVMAWLIGILFLGGCTSSRDGARPAVSEGKQPSHRVVNLAIWSNYLSQEVIQRFEKKTGVRVQVSNYSSNEELLAKLQAGASEYDLIIPSDYSVSILAKLGLMTELDYTQIPNAKNIDSKFLKKEFDPKNQYSVPYVWGLTGIAINRALYAGKIKSWKELFDRPDLAGKFSLLDDSREVIGAALKALGYSINSVDSQQLDEAKKLLLKARSRVKAFTSEPFMPLMNGELPVAQIYLSDALQVRKTKGAQIEFILPEEGSSLWIDNLVIPSRAQHVEEAHLLLNYLLEPQVAAETVKAVWVAPTHRGVQSLLPTEYRRHPLLFPSVSALSRCEMLKDVESVLPRIDRIWTEMKLAH